MLIGLYDLDMLSYNKFFPSLDLMKYSSYHKKNGDIVKFLYNEENWEVFDKIYVFRDRFKKLPPKNISSNYKVEWLGRKFFNDKTIQLADEVESCIPDTSIYSTWYEANKDLFCNDRRLLLNGILYHGIPCRITFNGKLVKSPEIKNQDNLYIYDIDAFKTKEIFKVLKNNIGAKLTFFGQQKIKDLEDLIYLQENFQVRKRINHILYNGDFLNLDYKKDYKYFYNQFQVALPIVNNKEESVIKFIQYLNRLYYSIAHDKMFYYDGPIKNEDNEYQKLVNALKLISKHMGKTSKFSALDIIKKYSKTLYRTLTNEWSDIYKEIFPLISIEINTIHEMGDWIYESK